MKCFQRNRGNPRHISEKTRLVSDRPLYFFKNLELYISSTRTDMATVFKSLKTGRFVKVQDVYAKYQWGIGMRLLQASYENDFFLYNLWVIRILSSRKHLQGQGYIPKTLKEAILIM